MLATIFAELCGEQAYGPHRRRRLRRPAGVLWCILRVALILFSAGSFAIYGAACFFSDYLKQEFVRYRLGRERVLVGVLQMCAALGLLLGLEVPWIGRALPPVLLS